MENETRNFYTPTKSVRISLNQNDSNVCRNKLVFHSRETAMSDDCIGVTRNQIKRAIYFFKKLSLIELVLSIGKKFLSPFVCTFIYLCPGKEQSSRTIVLKTSTQPILEIFTTAAQRGNFPRRSKPRTQESKLH